MLEAGSRHANALLASVMPWCRSTAGLGPERVAFLAPWGMR
jgi:hypothetical protein